MVNISILQLKNKSAGEKSFPMVSGTKHLVLPFLGGCQSSEGDAGPSALTNIPK